MGLDEELAAARSRYVAARPRSRLLAQRATDVLPGGNTRSVLHVEPYPFRVATVDGPVLVDVDGNRCLDLLGDYSAGLLGHRHDVVATALRARLDAGWSFGALSEPEVALAEALTARFPSMDQVRFTNSGTEANLLAIQAARHATGRDRVVVFDGAYHGGLLYFGPSGAPLRAPFDFLVLPYNDVEAVGRAFDDHGDRIACVLVEPMLGAGGGIRGDRAFLAALRERTAASGAHLVFDEVMTSRLAIGGAQDLLGIRPDLTTLGKYLAGGSSFGAFGGSRSVMGAFDPDGGGLTHGGTFNNDAFTMAAGVAVDRVVSAPGVLADLTTRGARLQAALSDVFARSALPMSVCGWGSIMTIHPVSGPVRTPADLDHADPRWRDLLFLDLLAGGYYIAARGYLALSLDITDRHVDSFVAAVADFCDRHVALA